MGGDESTLLVFVIAHHPFMRMYDVALTLIVSRRHILCLSSVEL